MKLPATVASLVVVPSLHAGAFHLDPTSVDPSLLEAVGDPIPVAAASSTSNTSVDRFEIEPYAIGASDYNGTTIFIGGVGAQWFVEKGLSVGVFGEAMHVNQPDDNAVGGGGGVLLRWHFVESDGVDLFVDAGVGFVLFDQAVPADAQTFDFTPRASFGAAFPIGERTTLDASIGWLHLSNAQTGENNPGLDTLAIGLAVRIEF